MKNPDILKTIVMKKKEKLELAKIALPLEELKSRVSGVETCRNFLEAINKPRQISLIAEIKKASPSKGVIRDNFVPAEIAKIYQEQGAAAISVLTEEDHFMGNLSYISEVKKAQDLPVLRKDFIFDAYQVYESRLYGADAILLIEDLLTKDQLTELVILAASLGMDCLVEVHDEKALKKVLGLKLKDIPFAIGINNRDLHTLEVDPKTTERLFMLIPRGRTVVIESGIRSRQDVSFLKILGANAVLIGQAFMEADDIAKKMNEIII